MDRKVTAEPAAGSPANPIPLPKNKKMLAAYYAGSRLPSPMGGHLDLLGVREGADGVGRVLMECNTSSLRFVLLVPKATKLERAAAKEVMAAGGELTCPRHGPDQRLTKSGKNWVCPLCGVTYAKA